MKLSLKAKVTVFIAAVVIIVIAVSTFLSISANTMSIEREVLARGVALSEALARSVSDGLAAENLNLIKHVENIVHTKDVLLTQVFSTLWLGVASVPADRLNTPPDPGAVEYLKSHPGEHDYYSIDQGDWTDIYHTIMLDPHDARVPKLSIGYVRLRVTREAVSAAVRQTVVNNILAGILLTLIAVIFLNALIAKYVIRPILDLHRSVAKHKQGEFPETVPVTTSDEIGELSSEFNEMSRALRERETKLAEEKERLSVTLRSIGDAVIVTDLAGTVTLFNKVAEHLTGWSAQEAVGRPLSEIFHIINDKTRERREHPVDKVITTGMICGLTNHTALLRRDGAEIIIEDSAAPVRDCPHRRTGPFPLLPTEGRSSRDRVRFY